MVVASPETPHTALFQTREGDRVRCGLCPHNCLLAEGQTGLCNVREVHNGSLVSLVYGHPVGGAVDPIEKKPLFHFHPGSPSFSYATLGCNFACSFCQNHHISQVRESVRTTRFVPPEALVQEAVDNGCRIVAHTYTEPTIYFEYASDVARLAHEQGLLNVFVTNGFISPAAIDRVAPFLDGANVDLKAFSDDFYRRQCRGRLQPVLDAIGRLHDHGVWVEVTTLVIPGLNDGDDELRDIARFLVTISPELPWHVSRFHPDYRLQDRGATPATTLTRAWEIGRREGLHHVYTGNIALDAQADTTCAHCGSVLIERRHFTVLTNRVENGVCPECRTPLAGRYGPR